MRVLQVLELAGRLIGMDARELRHTAANVLFARRRADPTGDWVTLGELGLAHPDRHPYVASPWWILHWLLPRSEVHPGDVFVEYGCGKGRIVIMAARRYPFASVLGIELSDELAATARSLIAGERRLRCPDVRVETADATAFRPPDSMTHAYMFNPFRGATMATVCANIAESLDRAPRRLKLIYVQPEEHETVVASGHLRLERYVRTTRLVGVNVGLYTTA